MLSIWTMVILACAFLPVASAASPPTPFPDIPFSAFSQVITEEFSADISLAAVVTILLSLIHNTDMLNLHGRQQTPRRPGENKQTVTGWMKAFVWSLRNRLGGTDSLMSDTENASSMSRDAQVSLVAGKMNTLAHHLGLTPFTQDGRFRGWLTTVSTTDIQPVRVLCPLSGECETEHCRRALRQSIREQHVSCVTLCEGTQVYNDVAVLSGICPGGKVCATNHNLTL